MKIYLASSLSPEYRDTMYKVLTVLRSLGHDVYGPVEHTIEDAWDYSNQDWGRLVFEADITAIKDADLVVAISYGRTKTTAGTNWEMGFAYGIGKRVIVIEMDEGVQSLMVSNGAYATVSGINGILKYDFKNMPMQMTDAEVK